MNTFNKMSMKSSINQLSIVLFMFSLVFFGCENQPKSTSLEDLIQKLEKTQETVTAEIKKLQKENKNTGKEVSEDIRSAIQELQKKQGQIKDLIDRVKTDSKGNMQELNKASEQTIEEVEDQLNRVKKEFLEWLKKEQQ